jgi:hypothetical protein
MKKLPFDLEKALAGHPLVTRSGEDATEMKRRIGYYTYTLSALIGGIERFFTDGGRWFSAKEEKALDLFLAVPETPEPTEPTEPDYTCQKYRASVLLAFADGAEIECRITGCSRASWGLCKSPRWNFLDFNYRVKPQPKAPRFCDATWKRANADSDPWCYVFLPGQAVLHRDEEIIPMIELTPEVIAALEAAGITTKGGES